MEFKAELFLTELFKAYKKIPALLPDILLKENGHGTMERRICDYVSGMTDRSSVSEYKKLFSPDEKESSL